MSLPKLTLRRDGEERVTLNIKTYLTATQIAYCLHHEEGFDRINWAKVSITEILTITRGKLAGQGYDFLEYGWETMGDDWDENRVTELAELLKERLS